MNFSEANMAKQLLEKTLEVHPLRGVVVVVVGCLAGGGGGGGGGRGGGRLARCYSIFLHERGSNPRSKTIPSHNIPPVTEQITLSCIFDGK